MSTKDNTPASTQGQIVLYHPDETITLEVKLEQETVWLNQQQLAELYGTKRQAITKHIANIYDCQELDRTSTSSILEQVRKEGSRMVTRKIEFYNLDMIISVGYRVRRLIPFQRSAHFSRSDPSKNQGVSLQERHGWKQSFGNVARSKAPEILDKEIFLQTHFKPKANPISAQRPFLAQRPK